jgi:hypothetical protein
MDEEFIASLKAGEIYHSVEVAKNTKGYNWTVKVAGMDMEAIKNRVVEVEKFCKEKFGSAE